MTPKDEDNDDVYGEDHNELVLLVMVYVIHEDFGDIVLLNHRIQYIEI